MINILTLFWLGLGVGTLFGMLLFGLYTEIKGDTKKIAHDCDCGAEKSPIYCKKYCSWKAMHSDGNS